MAFAAQQDQEEEEAPIAGGSVTVPEENEAAESELARLDRIAAGEATLDAVPGEIRDIELENEDGFVVYEVEVAGENGGRLYEVIVDAGNGEVVGLEAEEEGPEGAD